jgi:hypothetical protein
MTIGVVLGTLAVVGAVVVIGVLIDRRVSLLPRPEELRELDAPPKPPPDPPGTVASAPLRLTARKLAKALVAQRCVTCRTRLDASPGEAIRFSGKELQLFRLTCATCGTGRGLYVEQVA